MSFLITTEDGRMVDIGEYIDELLEEIRTLKEQLAKVSGPDFHIIELREDTGWTIMHPMACRPHLFDCPLNIAALNADSFGAIAAPGRYRCELTSDGRIEILESAA
jgi:hypothetical protein